MLFAQLLFILIFLVTIEPGGAKPKPIDIHIYIDALHKSANKLISEARLGHRGKEEAISEAISVRSIQCPDQEVLCGKKCAVDPRTEISCWPVCTKSPAQCSWV